MHLLRKRITILILVIGMGSIILISFRFGKQIFASTMNNLEDKNVEFSGKRSYEDLQYQVSLGPRTPGSQAHQQCLEWIRMQLTDSGWDVSVQESTYMNYPVRNIIAKKGSGNDLIILGAHYDSRFRADHDPEQSNHILPVPGANDGASGVAVLLELARTLQIRSDQTIWLVFFDFEDQGRIEGMDWIIGSSAFVETLTEIPQAVVIIDMSGDKSLNIFQEQNSDPMLSNDIWNKADELGYGDIFLAKLKYRILDDHIPFLNKGIPAIDIIDFDYPYWHTVDDTVDRTSPESLEVVGRTLWYWIADK